MVSADENTTLWEANADAWTRLSRAGHDIYRDVLNTPAFVEMMPEVAGQSGLDIGCGEGTNTRAVAALGAKMSAIDVSPSFIAHARQTEAADPKDIDFHVADAMALPFEDAAFDFATAFMSLMDMPDHRKALDEAARVLKPGGFLQFSILHPCFAPPYRKPLREADGTVRAIAVGRYFDTEPYVERWCFGSVPEEDCETLFAVPIYHRTLSGWFEVIAASGLIIEALGEPRATPEMAADCPTVADTLTAPLFLHVRLRKPSQF